MEPLTGPEPHRPSRRRVIAAAVAVLVVAGVIASGVLIAVRPPWLRDVKTALQQVPVVGGLPGIVAAPTGLPAPQVVTPGATLSPVAPGATPNASFGGRADTVPLENRPEFAYVGSLDWQIHQTSQPGRLIEGYASAPSYFPGETLKLAVSTTAPSYVATIWRVSGAAPAESPFVPVATIESTPGRQQAPAVVDPSTKMVRAPWDVTTTFPIPADWPSGMYLVRLDSAEGVQSYVPFVLRSRAATAFLLVSNALNWEAYNQWGGSSVYVTRIGDPLPGVTRALAVSFDRPYASDGGAGQLFFLELPFISWIERAGLDVSFTTDYDLSLNPAAQPLPRTVIFNGHGEYWGPPLYGWLESHVAAGDMGVAMFAADTGYWPISFGPATPDGPRSFMCLKNGPVPAAFRPPGQTPESSEAPIETLGPGETEERGRPGYVSLGADGPYVGAFADQPLFGVHYRGVTSVLGRYSIVASGADPRLLAGTGLAANGSLGFIAGGEVDGVLPFAEWWGPLRGAYDHPFAVAAGLQGRLPSLRWTAEAVWRELPSGGRVFASGTFYWGWALDPDFASSHGVSPDFPRLTRNILNWLATGT